MALSVLLGLFEERRKGAEAVVGVWEKGRMVGF